MLFTPLKNQVNVISNIGIVGSVTPGTNLTSNGTTLLDGAVTEVISAASNIQDSWGIDIWIMHTGVAATASQGCVDILIGGATDEVLIAALLCGYGALPGGGGWHWFFPLHIPAGNRIAATFASIIISKQAQIIISLYGGGVAPWRCGTRVTTYGTQVNNARGQAVVPTASGGAASVTQLSAGTSANHFAFLPGFVPQGDTTITPAGWQNIGIGIGAATEERIGTWWMKKDTDEDCAGWFPPLPAFKDVPSGTRLTMLASNSGANDSGYDGLIYAIS